MLIDKQTVMKILQLNLKGILPNFVMSKISVLLSSGIITYKIVNIVKIVTKRERILYNCLLRTFLASLFFMLDVDTDITRLIITENTIPTIVNNVDTTISSTTMLLKNVGNKTAMTKDTNMTKTNFIIAVIYQNILS